MQPMPARATWDALFDALLADRDVLTARVRGQMQNQLPAYARLSAESLDPVVWGEISGLVQLARAGRVPMDDGLFDEFGRVGEARAGQGVPLEDVLRAWRLGVFVILERARELGGQLGVGPEELLDFAESVLVWSDAAMVRLAGGHRAAELEALRHAQAQSMQFVRDVLLGSVSPTDVRIKAQAYGLDPDLSYVTVRARPTAGTSTRDLERSLGFLDAYPYRRGLSTLVEGEIAGFLRSAPASDQPGIVGVGPPGRLDSLEHSFRIAGRALATATAFGLVGARDLRSLGVRPAVLADRDVGETLRARYLAPLEASGSTAELAATVRTYLACGMHVERTAEKLFVHANTLRYRIGRFEELTEASLREPGTAFEVWWALESAALAGRESADELDPQA
ncbi:MAG: PucR family transcriptional regulator [Sporichthyaceae bacterium]